MLAGVLDVEAELVGENGRYGVGVGGSIEVRRTAGIGATSPSACVPAKDRNLIGSRRRVIGRHRLRAEISTEAPSVGLTCTCFVPYERRCLVGGSRWKPLCWGCRAGFAKTRVGGVEQKCHRLQISDRFRRNATHTVRQGESPPSLFSADWSAVPPLITRCFLAVNFAVFWFEKIVLSGT
jgi:hypothetical protein